MYEDFNTIEEIYNYNCEGPSDIFEHLPTLVEYANKVDHITEFGTRWGCSTSAFLFAKPKKLICYDLGIRKEMGKLKKLAESDFEFHKGNTLEIEIDETDILFIDTLHTYNQLSQELKLHSDKAHKFIILHDTVKFAIVGDNCKGNLPPQEGLQKAIDEFLAENKKWRLHRHFENNNGLTILKRYETT